VGVLDTPRNTGLIVSGIGGASGIDSTSGTKGTQISVGVSGVDCPLGLTPGDLMNGVDDVPREALYDALLSHSPNGTWLEDPKTPEGQTLILSLSLTLTLTLTLTLNPGMMHSPETRGRRADSQKLWQLEVTYP